MNQKSPLFELAITIVIPALILMKLSGPEELGSVGALLMALAFPLGWGALDLVRCRRLNLFAVLGLVSVLLTGGIGLLQLDPQWLAVKEAAVPAVIGLAVLVSSRTRYPLVKTLLFNPVLLDVERVHRSLEQRATTAQFEVRLQYATYFLGATFFFSAAMNWLLATWIVNSPAGTAAFNEELGRMTLLSYPVIAIPSTLMMVGILFYLARSIHRLSGLRLAQLIRQNR